MVIYCIPELQKCNCRGIFWKTVVVRHYTLNNIHLWDPLKQLWRNLWKDHRMSIPFLRAYIRYEPRLAISSTFGICYSLSIGLVLILSTGAKCYRCLQVVGISLLGGQIDPTWHTKGLWSMACWMKRRQRQGRRPPSFQPMEQPLKSFIYRISECLVSHTLAGPAWTALTASQNLWQALLGITKVDFHQPLIALSDGFLSFATANFAAPVETKCFDCRWKSGFWTSWAVKVLTEWLLPQRRMSRVGDSMEIDCGLGPWGLGNWLGIGGPGR